MTQRKRNGNCFRESQAADAPRGFPDFHHDTLVQLLTCLFDATRGDGRTTRRHAYVRNPAQAKENNSASYLLRFAFMYFSESGLFNRLPEKKLRLSLPLGLKSHSLTEPVRQGEPLETELDPANKNKDNTWF